VTSDPVTLAPQRASDSAYDADFCAWAVAQANLLRAGRLAEADIAHIAEEIEDLAKRDRRELASRVRTVMEHQLRLTASPPRNRAASGLGGDHRSGARRDRPLAGGQPEPSGNSAGCHRP
jgi:hypothetical protein